MDSEIENIRIEIEKLENKLRYIKDGFKYINREINRLHTLQDDNPEWWRLHCDFEDGVVDSMDDLKEIELFLRNKYPLQEEEYWSLFYNIEGEYVLYGDEMLALELYIKDNYSLPDENWLKYEKSYNDEDRLMYLSNILSKLIDALREGSVMPACADFQDFSIPPRRNEYGLMIENEYQDEY